LTAVIENERSREIQKVLKIFIASSTELNEEREKLIHIFNSINKCLTHLRLEAIKWETDIESGNFDKQRIQDEINPLLEDCPMVFVLFFSKVGKFTLEEFRLAEQKNKKIFIYFKKNFPLNNLEELKNYEKVLELKQDLTKENRALYKEYETIAQFESLVYQDINLYISRNYPPDQMRKTTELDEYRKNIRIIDTNRKASTSEVLIEKSLNDLDQDQLTGFFALERVRAQFLGNELNSIEGQLCHLDLLSPQNALKKGTFLCFGKHIDGICPTASSKFFVFTDKKGVNPLKTEWVRGNLITQYEKMLEHLMKNLYLVRDIYSDKKEDYEIPHSIFRELLANAFIHRDYSWDIKSSIQVELYPDRLEVKNPGTLPEEIDQEKLGEIDMSYARNIEIQLIFFLYKFVERAGKGIRILQETLKKEEFKPAVITDNKRGRYVKVIVYKKAVTKKEDYKKSPPSTILLTPLPARKIELIGRQEELKWLSRQLQESNRVLLVNGLGGIGKTEVCKRFFLDHYREFAFAGWIDYVTSIKESLVNAFGFQPDLVKMNEADTLDERYHKILVYLNSLDSNSLLVFDNIEDPGDPDLDALTRLPFKVIANSRSVLPGFLAYTLDFLSESCCRDLFYKYYQLEKDDEGVNKIVERCGRHTLSVELLARTAQNAGMSVTSFYELLTEQGFNLNDVIGDKVYTFWHDEKTRQRFFDHLLKIFDISAARVTESELQVLTNLSVLPAIYIPMETLKEWLELETNEEINGLVSKGWLKRDRTTIFMQQVIQEVIRYKTHPDVKTCGKLTRALADNLSAEPGENPLDKKKYVIYADSLLQHIHDLHEDAATLANNLSLIYQALGQLEPALEFQKKAINILENVLDKNHPNLASSYNNLSMIYQDLGQLEPALEFQLKDVKISEQILDKNHPSLATSYNNLSLIYQDLGQLEPALEFQKKATEIYEAVLDKNHPSLATSYNNLSLIYQTMGQLEPALEFQKKALEIREAVLDKNHPSLATSYNNLSMVYQSLGQLEPALEFQKKTVEIFEKILDKNHPSLATSFHNLSTIYLDMAEYPAALQYAEKAVTILQTLFPNGHPNLDTAKHNLEKIKKVVESKS
jgi:tetratricopeptide (TPR) repeat protein